jgi:NAD(P)-dependent dehydrogenase (short-subunit alcohol dehydrogenase family)
MGVLDGRVAVITGAGRGLGREYALLFAAEGASVVVNDLGTGPDGEGASAGPAHDVVAEIEALGGTAVANTNDIADWDGGRRLIEQAVDSFGRLDVLVNNAGILRDRFLVNMSEEEWDSVIRVHLKGHFVPTRWAAEHWRDRHKTGEPVRGSVINTTSASGLIGNRGQTNYGSAKAGIALFTITTAKELGRYGVRVNAVSPAARTRLLLATPGLADRATPPDDDGAFDQWDPQNISPLVAWLATGDCPATGRVFLIHGGTIRTCRPFVLEEGITKDGRWTIDDLRAAEATLLGDPVVVAAR